MRTAEQGTVHGRFTSWFLLRSPRLLAWSDRRAARWHAKQRHPSVTLYRPVVDHHDNELDLGVPPEWTLDG